MNPTTRFTLRIAAPVLLVLILAACRPADPDLGLPEYVLRAEDYTFETPAEIPAGRAWITFENEGAELHHVQFLRLNDGISLDQFQSALQQQGEAALALTSMPGGVGVLAPDHAGRVLLDLVEGQYVLLCFLPDAQGVPHLAKGMNVPVRVVAGRGAATPDPEVAASAGLLDFAIQLPAEVAAGEQLWKVTNAGPQPHELMVVKLVEGQTAADALAYLGAPQGPAPFEWQGGMQGLTTGQSGWLDLDLAPGNYIAFCQIPDPASGQPHFQLGMSTAFKVK